MISLEQLRQTENIVKNPPVSARVQDIRGGVWSQSQMEQALPGWPFVTVKVDKNVIALTDDHLYGYHVLPNDFVSISYRMPCFNMNAFSGPQDRLLETVADVIEAYYKDRRVIETAEELVAYVNETYP